MDRMGANFMRTRDMIETQLGANPLILQLPIGAEDGFEGIFDLVRMKAITWNGEVCIEQPLILWGRQQHAQSRQLVWQELGASFEESDDIPAGMEDLVSEWREKLLDATVELDDALMEAYLEVHMHFGIFNPAGPAS